MTAAGHLPLAFYPSFDVDDDPASGFTDGDAPPRFSQAYATTRNRLGILVETHSWRTYPERVAATRHVLEAVLAEAALHGRHWRDVEAAADAADRGVAGKPVVLMSRGDPAAPRTIAGRERVSINLHYRASQHRANARFRPRGSIPECD